MDIDRGLALFLLSLAGIFAGIINTMAGGGSFLTIPALLLLGLPPAVANATNRLAILVQSFAASIVFYREGKLQLKRGLLWSFVMAIGAASGAYTAAVIDEEKFVSWFGVLFVGMSIILIRKAKLKALASETRWAHAPIFVFPALLGVGFYGGFIQAGVGVLILLCLGLVMSSDIVAANGLKNLMVFFYTVPVLIIFAKTGLIDYQAGSCLAVGNALGAFIGARLSMRISPLLLTYFVSIIALVTGLTLIFRTL